MKNLMFVFDRMPDQDGCTFVEVENESGESVNAGEWRLREDGLAELVVPVGHSQSFDEAQERELFEVSAVHASEFLGRGASGEYQNPYVQSEWEGWLACAKSRANNH